MKRLDLVALLCLLLALGAPRAVAQGFDEFDLQPSPFSPPQAKLQYAPDREYDLQNVSVRLAVDYGKLSFSGTVVDTLAPLRDDLKAVTLHCGQGLTVDACDVEGHGATFTRDGESLRVALTAPAPAGKPLAVTVRYHSGEGQRGGGFGMGGGWHWIRPTADNPSRVGFWTQGEEMSNRQWVPMWDYPNDFTASEEVVTVPEDWYVVGNGELVSNTRDAAARTRTFRWRMREPHATYLISLAAGPMDTRWASWNGVKLLYAVPRGRGRLIDASFGDTPDMLAFFSQVTGVKYPWSKYAQSAMYDFGGGMENVSATTLQEAALTDGRDGGHPMASLNSHELAHQWFGDFVTCEDWGQSWLNEGFATFLEVLYMEHSRGKDAYARDIEGNLQSYLNESRRYIRPLSTKLYSNAGVLFDRHAYPKGALVLHTLRRRLGDRAFFAGLRLYLERYGHSPVRASDLARALTEASGVNMDRFFDDWVYKPGHPVLDYAWRWDDATRQVVMTVKQTQNPRSGTPIYSLPLTVGLIADGKLTRETGLVDTAEAELRFTAARKPDAVLLDPDHDFLREIPKQHWADAELPAIVRFAPNCVDRQQAMTQMLAGTPSDAAVQVAVEAIRADKGAYPAFASIGRLAELSRPDLRPLFREMLGHASITRRMEAAQALAIYPKQDDDMAALRKLISDKEPDPVIQAAMGTLATWDAKGNAAAFAAVARMTATRPALRASAAQRLASSGAPEAEGVLLEMVGQSQPRDLRAAALLALKEVPITNPRTTAALRECLRGKDALLCMRAAACAAARKEKSLLPDIQAAASNPPPATGLMKDALTNGLSDAVGELSK